MPNASRKSRFKVKLFDRAAAVRLGVLLSVLLILCVWAYSAMFWMPGRSYQGDLPLLTQDEQTLAASLEQHVQTLANDIVIRNYSQLIAFIGNLRSGELIQDAIASFRKSTQFPSEGVSFPAWVPGIGWSDQWSFWQEDYLGIMVTDTAPYRYPHYHTERDTLDKVDFEKLARVVKGLSTVIDDLAA